METGGCDQGTLFNHVQLLCLPIYAMFQIQALDKSYKNKTEMGAHEVDMFHIYYTSAIGLCSHEDSAVSGLSARGRVPGHSMNLTYLRSS